MKKRSDKNSATSAVAGFASVIDDAILPPAGVESCSDKEHLIWNQFTRARAKDDWRDMDLILLTRIVKMEADIRAAQVELDAVGMMVENKRGAQIPMQPFGQGFKDMAPAVDKLEQLVAERKLRHGSNPILNMCAAGAVIQSDPAGNRKLNKAKSYSKIDGLVALSMALGSMSADEIVSATSPWDDPEFELAV